MLFLLRGRGSRASFLRRILASYYEVVNFREYLDITAIVHNNDVVIIRAIFMNRGLI